MRGDRSTSIRSVLARVVLAAALPVWLASALLIYKVQADGRALIERDAGATARALMVAVDRDLASAEVAASVLATSPILQSGDLAAFYARVSAILPSGIGNNLVLSDRSGRQVLNTLRPYGDKLPRHGDPDLLARVFTTGKPAVSDLYVGAVRGRPVVSIDVPVIRDHAVVYDLSIGLFPERLGEILRQEQLPDGWVASIFDSKGTIVARTHAAEQYVGQTGAPALVEQMARTAEGMVQTKTLEGIEVSALFSRSQVSSWAVAIGVPTAELTVQLWRSLALSLMGTLVLIALSLAAAFVTGRRITRPIRALAAIALAQGDGRRAEITSLGLKEADDLARALVAGARLLEARTVERDRAEQQRQQILTAKQHADEAARARSAYFAYLSHELRTPLTAVLGCAELIAGRTRATSQDAKSLDYCARINHGVQHLISVINDILEYARYEAQEIELHKVPLDAASEIRGVVDLLAARAELAGVELRCEIALNLPPVCADRVRLRQIMLNLVSNAKKFTPSGGSVTVSVAAAADAQMVICVEDTGVGISAEDLPRILEPFAQVENAQATRRKGSGLGLPLTKGLVELHGGTLAMASAPGVGTVVTVRLPLGPEAMAAFGGSRGVTTGEPAGNAVHVMPE